MIKNEQGWRRMFFSAALYNWIVAGVFAVAAGPIVAALGIAPKPEPAMWFYLFLTAVGLFGGVYFIVSRDLSQRALVKLGAIGKALVFGIILANWLTGVATWHVLGLGTVDAVYTFLFVQFLAASRKPK
jgi:hypothetical protein